jgi:phosphoribosylamine---glycine ligase
VLLEERLVGQEVSLLVVCDGRDAVPLRLAQDYKQALDGDRGPMTGGMGTVAPVDLLDDAALEDVMRRVVRPTLDGLRAEGTPFVGTLFVGLMLTERGPLVLEYNVRFGDPETQALLPLLESDLFELLATPPAAPRRARAALARRRLRLRGDGRPRLPGSPRTGTPLDLPDDLGEHVLVFHAGTRLEEGAGARAGAC